MTGRRPSGDRVSRTLTERASAIYNASRRLGASEGFPRVGANEAAEKEFQRLDEKIEEWTPGLVLNERKSRTGNDEKNRIVGMSNR